MEPFEVRVRRWAEMTEEFLQRLSTDARIPTDVQAEAHRLRGMCEHLGDGYPAPWWPELSEQD
jgi:hypothetical protein